MSITNNQIMALYKAENNIPQNVQLFTAGVWSAKGYKIKKGEKCMHRVALWGHGKPTTDDEGNKVEGCLFMKTSCLFTDSQVEKKVKR